VTRELPEPDSEALKALVTSEESRAVYEFLYERRDDPPTQVEIDQYVATYYGVPHSQTERRKRALRDVYLLDVRTERVAGRRDPVYRLVGFLPEGGRTEGRRSVNGKARAEVLTRYHSRCTMCGKTPTEDGIKLEIDHIVPLEWGGTNSPENLQPLCRECNAGKKAHYSSFDENAEAIKAAIGREGVHERIGELLKALEGQPVPVELITIVAREENAGDPTRRMRALRDLGWVITVSYRTEGKRKRSFYTLEHWEPYPPEGVRAALKRMGKSA